METIIPLWPNGAVGSEDWTQAEQETLSPHGGYRLVHNVAQPTVTAYLPDPSIANGTAVVVCPGGGFHYLEIEKEGTDMAYWLNARGVAAFVLKYRLIRTGDKFLTEMHENLADRNKMPGLMASLRPLVIADGQQAIRMVRERANEWGIRPDRIGIVGFSAGGMVSVNAALQYDAGCRPDFAAPIYSAPVDDHIVPVPADAPPLFLVCADDDDLVQVSVHLYTKWKATGRSAELHIYSKGGHGFGLKPHGLPVDTWTDRFDDWLRAQEFLNAG